MPRKATQTPLSRPAAPPALSESPYVGWGKQGGIARAKALSAKRRKAIASQGGKTGGRGRPKEG